MVTFNLQISPCFQLITNYIHINATILARPYPAHLGCHLELPKTCHDCNIFTFWTCSYAMESTTVPAAKKNENHFQLWPNPRWSPSSMQNTTKLCSHVLSCSSAWPHVGKENCHGLYIIWTGGLLLLLTYSHSDVTKQFIGSLDCSCPL